MKLARKLTMALVLGILTVMGAYAYVQVRREVVLVDGVAERLAQVTLATRRMLEDVWSQRGPGRVAELLNIANEVLKGDVEVRLVPLGEPLGDTPPPALSPDQRAALLAGARVQLVREDENGVAWHFTYAPLTVDGRRPAAIEARESLRQEQTYIHMNHVSILIATLAVVLACGLIATALEVRLVGRPLELLRDKARRAGAGDFSGLLALRQRDEIGDLAKDINAMCERLAEARQRIAEEMDSRMEALEQLRHTDRLATVGQLAAGVAHDLGTPLSVVSARAQLLASTDLPRAEVAKSARAIVEQADRMAERIQQLLDLSRRRPARPTLGSLQQVAARVCELLGPVAARAGVKLVLETSTAPLLARLDQSQMLQVLSNLVLNGIQAIPVGGHVRVRVETRHARPPANVGGPEGDYPCVTVEDDGPGIPSDQLDRVFEPFFTTKPPGEGTGLGLPVAQGIVNEHGGWIEVESERGRGTRFSVLLAPSGGEREAAVEVAS